MTESLTTEKPKEEVKKKAVRELSPEWFDALAKHYELIDNKDALNVLRYFRNFVDTPVPDEVEILKKYTAEPMCRTCHGTGRIGINRILDKDRRGSFYQLQLCHCVKPIDSEFKRTMDKLEKIEQMITVNNQRITYNLSEIFTHTFRGGLKTGWSRMKMNMRFAWARVKKMFTFESHKGAKDRT